MKTLYPIGNTQSFTAKGKLHEKTKIDKTKKSIENDLLKGEYVDIGKKEFQQIAQAIASRKKDAVLNIRINSQDLKNLKQKAKKFGIKYQTFVSEVLHRFAQI